MRRICLSAATVAGLVAAGLLTVSAFDGGASASARQSASRGTLTNSGIRVTLSPTSRFRLRRVGIAKVFLLGRKHRAIFYRIYRRDGVRGSRSCFAIAHGRARGDIGAMTCTYSFPSVAVPLLDMSVLEGASPGSTPAMNRRLRFFSIEGFAADGVAVVGAVDDSGAVVATTEVTGNTYKFENVPDAFAGGLVAMDANGNVLYRITYR